MPFVRRRYSAAVTLLLLLRRRYARYARYAAGMPPVCRCQ